MRKLFVFLFVFLFSVPAFADIGICSDGAIPFRCGVTWDFNIDLGGGKVGDDAVFLARARSGIMFVYSELFMSAGISAFYNSKFNVGIQGDLVHMKTGLWISPEVALSTSVKPVVGVSGGWSLFGAEMQVEFDNGPHYSWYGKVRIPVGIIMLVFK